MSVQLETQRMEMDINIWVWLKCNLENIQEIEKSKQDNKTAALVCTISCQQFVTLPTTFSSNTMSNLGFLSLFATNKRNQKEMETKPAQLLKDSLTDTHTQRQYLESMIRRDMQVQILPGFRV